MAPVMMVDNDLYPHQSAYKAEELLTAMRPHRDKTPEGEPPGGGGC